MKNLAIEQQQCFYELLPEYIEYQFNEHKFLRQNIGHAIYGLPEYWLCDLWTSNKKSKDISDTDADIADIIEYDEKAKNVIDIIYNKICEYTIGTNNTQPIYFGIIYNIIFPPKMNINKETKTAKKESVKEEEEKEPTISSIPIFTIRRNIEKKSDTPKNSKENTKIENKADYEIWYIDTCGRVYKSWLDYVENNNLPKCTMILPKDGFYQADVFYPITEDYSTVWLEITESPACRWTSVICSEMDVVSNIAGLGTVVASLFIPLRPIAVMTGQS